MTWVAEAFQIREWSIGAAELPRQDNCTRGQRCLFVLSCVLCNVDIELPSTV